MRIVCVTGCLPYGPGETFIIDEIRELLRRNEVLVVPRSPRALGQHAEWLVPYTWRENLLSGPVLRRAVRVAGRMPRRAVASARFLFGSRSPAVAVRNLAVYPKALWLAAVAREWRADHIHCHWAGTTATMAMIASELSGIPWSLTAHRSDIVSNNLLAAKARAATLVRAIAQDGRNMLIARGVPDDAKLHVLPMGVRIPQAVRRGHARSQVVLSPADLLEVKGHQFLIRAWRILVDRGVAAKLWLAGSGELRTSLQRLTADLELTEFVTFLGTISHQSLLDLYQQGQISAVALASVDLGRGCHEGIPVALVEAMSYGVPVIGTTTGGIPELVRPGTGLLVPPENPQALAEALEQILRNDGLAEAIGESGRRWIVETRDVAFIASELEVGFSGRVATPLLTH